MSRRSLQYRRRWFNKYGGQKDKRGECAMEILQSHRKREDRGYGGTIARRDKEGNIKRVPSPFRRAPLIHSLPMKESKAARLAAQVVR